MDIKRLEEAFQEMVRAGVPTLMEPTPLQCPCRNWTVSGMPLPPEEHNPSCPDHPDNLPEPQAQDSSFLITPLNPEINFK